MPRPYTFTRWLDHQVAPKEAVNDLQAAIETIDAGGTNAGGSIATATDVALVSPSTGDVLKYNAVTGKWGNGTDLVGGGTGAGAECIRVSAYTGANGMTNAAIQAALNASAGTTPVLIDTPGVYTFTNPLTIGAAWPRTVLISPDKANTIFRANLSSGYYAGTSKAFIKQSEPARVVDDSTPTTAYPIGTNKLTLTSGQMSAVAVGDLVLFGLATKTSPGGTNEGNEGEIRLIIYKDVAANQIWLDAPLVLDMFNNSAAKRMLIYHKREAFIRGITFDTTETDAQRQGTPKGHGATQLNFFTRVVIQDCDFIGGGRQGFGVTYAHTAIIERCRAEECVTTAGGLGPSFTDPRTGTVYPAVTGGVGDDVSGEAYGFAVGATYTMVRDCTAIHNRHAIAGGATPYHTLWSIYDHCKAERDMQGAFDWHSHTNYAIARDCVASAGEVGFVVRGRNQWILDCDSFDCVVGIKIFEFADHCRIRGGRILASSATTDTSGGSQVGVQFGHNWNLTTHYGLMIEDLEIDGMQTYVFQADTAGNTFRDCVFRNIKITRAFGGTWASKFSGLWIDPVFEGWRITGTAPGAATTDAPIQFYADAGTASIKGVKVRDFTVNGEAGALPNLVSLFATTSGGTLAANTYQDIAVTDNVMRTSGTPNSAVVVVASGAAVSGNLDQRRNRVNTTWVGAPTITGAKSSNAALTSLLSALAASGDVIDSTT